MTESSPEPTSFGEAVQKARAAMSVEGAPPTLDATQLGTDIDALTSEYLWDEADEIERSLPEHDRTDPAARAVVASMLWKVSQLAFMPDETQYHLLPERRELFRRYLAFRPAGSIDDLPILRWELQAAAAANDLERVVTLGRRAEELDPQLTELPHVARIVFLLISSPIVDGLWWPSYWEPSLAALNLRNSLKKYTDVMTVFRATTVERPATQPGSSSWVEPKAFNEHVLDALHLCQSWLDRAQRRTGALVDSAAFVRCWCDYALGHADSNNDRLRRAANGYITLAKCPTLEQLQSQHLAIRAAVHCRLLAGDFAEAEPLIRELLKEVPTDAALWRKLTLCLIKLERMAEAAVAFVEYSGRQPDGNDGIWLSPLVMHLGAQAMTHQTVAMAIESAALFAPARQLGERLMQWYSPWTTSMSVPALKKWWVGLYIVGADETHQNIGEGVWEHAIVWFAEAVVLELKAKVFIPAGDQNKQMIASIPEIWRLAFAGRATLGQCVECLLQTRRPQSAAAKALRHFIDTRVPDLNEYLGVSGRELENLNALRRRAQHGDLDSRSAPPPPLTKTDTEQVFKTATAVLQLLNSSSREN